MKIVKRGIVAVLVLVLFFSPIMTPASFAASTISVKLANYLGNKTEINVDTSGSYKLENGNIRLSGANRYEVASNIASSEWDKADTVIIVNQKAFADALSATPLAYKKNAPILLVKADDITAQTRQKLTELDPTNILIVGGQLSVSTSVENQLKSIAQVRRIDGRDRFQVSQKIANELGSTGKAIVTNGYKDADALAIAPYAAKNQYPILLTRADEIPNYTKEALKGKQSVTIIGGEVSVTKKVEEQLPQPTRIAGRDRYEVSANIAKRLNLDASKVYLANGADDKLADALTGSVVAAKNNAPILLTKVSALPTAVANLISEKATKSFVLLGGPLSISTELENQLPNALYLDPNSTYTVKVSQGKIGIYKGNDKLKDFGTSSFRIIPDSYNASNKIALNGRAYLGTMEFGIENNKYVRPINKDIPFEDYLKSVVPKEMPSYWHGEALKAQAVAARTYSAKAIGNTVLDTQAFQVYGGYDWYVSTSKAVDATKGQVLKYNGRLIDAVFSSSNGGVTESNANAWGSSQVPYLPSMQDTFDEKLKWSYSLAQEQIKLSEEEIKDPSKWWNAKTEIEESKLEKLKKWIIDKYYPNSSIKIAKINEIKIAAKNSSGRAKTVIFNLDYFVKDKYGKITSYTNEFNIAGESVRTLFGTMEIKSTLINKISFVPEKGVLTIEGSGFGHGVGMSQHGANNRANEGQTYQEILKFYYPGTNLTSY